MSDKELLTAKQAAAMMSLATATVYELASSGKLRHLRLGPANGAIRFRREDVEQYIADCTHEAGEPKSLATPAARQKHRQNGPLTEFRFLPSRVKRAQRPPSPPDRK